MENIKIKTALISVFEKKGVVEIASFLAQNKVKIISTGGTYKLLKDSGIDVIEISEYTGFPEMMSGRLKTLHPKIHGGLLGRSEDVEVMTSQQIEKIDLTIVNLYPFEETVKAGGTFEEIIEKIDIGGPSMVRSSAKNFKYTTVITDATDYDELKKVLEENDFCTDIEFRKNCAAKAFMLTAFYDSVIANWFGYCGEMQAVPLRKKQELRYGENPHQKAVAFEIPLSGTGILSAKKLQGKELSYNNIADADAACEVAFSFKEPTICIVKHANPCGVASANSIEEAYEDALKCDSRSAFGGIVASNMAVTKELAEKMKSHFFEVIIAPSFEKEAIEIFAKKINLRLLEAPDFKISEGIMLKQISGGILMQDVDSKIVEEKDLTLVSGKSSKIEDLLFSFNCVKFFKSNAIIITSGTKLISYGCGQTSRVDAMEIACRKMQDSGVDPSTCILSSDAFFPFTDNLELAKKYGINTIIAPSGSVKDEEVKEFAKNNSINLYFASTRHFKH